MGSCVALLPDLSRRRECAPLTAGKSGIERFSLPFNRHLALQLRYQPLVCLGGRHRFQVCSSIYYPAGPHLHHLLLSPQNQGLRRTETEKGQGEHVRQLFKKKGAWLVIDFVLL